MVFHDSLPNSKSLQVSRTLSFLADINNVVATIHPLIPKSFNLFINPLATVLSEPVRTGITATFMFHSFFSSLARSRYLPFFRFLSVLLCGQPELQCPLFGRFSFLLNIIRSGRPAEIRWSVCILKYPSSECISFFRKDYYYYYCYLFQVFFYTSFSWWFFAGVWVTASLLKSPGFSSVFWPISMML